MKYAITVLLALAMVFALVGCGAAEAPAPAAPDPLVSVQPSAIYEEAAKVNPKGEKVKLLVVVDMQNDFVDQALGTPEAVAIVPAVVAKINEYKANGDLIYATRDTHEPSYMDTQEGANLPVEHCVKDTEGWFLNDEVTAALGDKVVYFDKPTFGSTDLVKAVGELVAKYGQPNVEVEVIGLCTDICVVSNSLLLKAFYPEMPISLDAACCAAVTPETHIASIKTMQMCQIKVTNFEG